MWIINILSRLLVLVVIQNVSAEPQITIYLTGETTIIDDCPKECPADRLSVPGYGGQCFKFLNRETSWESATARCEQEGMVLARPSNNIAIELRKLLLDTYSDSDPDAVWVDARGTGSTMSWTGETASVDLDLMVSWDHQDVDTRSCMAFWVHGAKKEESFSTPYGVWACSHRAPVLCQDAPSLIANRNFADTAKLPECSGDRIRVPGYGGQCFKFINEEASWESARARCEQGGMVLARPSNKIAIELRKLLLDTYSDTDPDAVWVDARGTGSTMSWTGETLSVRPDLIVSWDRQDVDTNACMAFWVHGAKKEKSFSTPYGVWSCSHRAPVLCQDTPSLVANRNFADTAKLPEVSCPESEGFYKSSNSQCFRYFEGGIQWEAAKEKCTSEGMVMAKPDEEILGELREGLKGIICPDGYNCHDVWLGARGSEENLAMTWDRDGSVISHDSPLWAEYEPNDELKSDWQSEWYCLTLGIGYVSETPPYRSSVCQHQYGQYPTLCEVIGA